MGRKFLKIFRDKEIDSQCEWFEVIETANILMQQPVLFFSLSKLSVSLKDLYRSFVIISIGLATK